MKWSEHIEELFIARLTGEISGEEERLLMDWMEEDPGHAALYNQFCTLWYARKWSMTAGKISSESAWKAISQKVSPENNRQRARLFRWAGIAASIVLVAAAAFLLYPSQAPTAPEIVLLPSPENVAVRLTLSTGEEIELKGALSKERSDSIYDAGIHILPDSAALVYKADDKTITLEIAYNTLTIPRGGEFSLTLSDGSMVKLNSESLIRYPVTFQGGKREVYLEGEACFQVEKNTEAPFVVHTAKTDVTVLGTTFNVSAYEDECHTIVTLVEGSVEVKAGAHCHTLLPGTQLDFHHADSRVSVREVVAEHYIAWTHGMFWFDAMPLDLLMKKISRWCYFDYRFNDDELKTKRYTGGFRKYDDARYILDIISGLYDVSFKIEQGIIVIDKKK